MRIGTANYDHIRTCFVYGGGVMYFYTCKVYTHFYMNYVDTHSFLYDNCYTDFLCNIIFRLIFSYHIFVLPYFSAYHNGPPYFFVNRTFLYKTIFEKDKFFYFLHILSCFVSKQEYHVEGMFWYNNTVLL